jgi:uncharacterized metal-binding protein YceD (DUF177 family)
MKLRLNPTEIPLKDLPLEGREYEYTRDSAELNESLKDLLGANPYKVKFLLKPMGNTYEIRGELATQMDLQCALCAFDFKFPIRQNFHEFLVIQKPLEKGDKLSHTNHAHEWESQGPEATLLESEVLRVGDFIHEIIALAEPIRPLGGEECDKGLCDNLKEMPKREWLSVGPEGARKDSDANPFKILEKMKLRS